MRHRNLLPLLFFGVFFYQPLVRAIYIGLSHNWWEFFWNHQTFTIAWFTLWQALLSTLAALALAIPAAYAFYTLKFFGSSLLAALIAIPFVLPTIVVAIAMKSFWSSSNIWVVITANIFMNFGFAARAIGRSLQSQSEDIQHAASIDGAGQLRTFLQITLPGIRESILNMAALIFLYCSANFGLVLVIGGGKLNTIETSIYNSTTQLFSAPKITAYVIIQCAITIVALYLSANLRTVDLVSSEQNTKKIPKWNQFPFLAAISTISVCFIALPLISVMRKSIVSIHSFNHLPELFSSISTGVINISLTSATLNSLRNACISMVIALGIGLYLSGATKSKFALLVAKVPMGVSAVILGLGYILTFNNGYFPLRSSWLVTPVAQSVILIPLVIQIVRPVQRGLNPEFQQVAKLDSLSDFQFWYHIQLPQLKAAIATAAGYVLIISIGEFGAANSLSYGDQATLPTLLYRLFSLPGSANFAAALITSSLLICFVAAVTLTIDLTIARSTKAVDKGRQ